MGFDLLLHLGAPSTPRASDRYVTSYILHPLALALLRILLSIYAFFTIFFQLGYESTSTTDERFDAQHSLSYFTNLSYWGLAFYFLFAGLHGLAFHFTNRRRQSAWRYFELERWPRGMQAAHAILYTSVVTFAPLVTIVFWAVIYRGPFYPLAFDAWKNISVHALNTAFAVLEIFLANTSTPPLLHLPILIIILLLYLGLAYLTHTVDGFYVYSFLDTQTKGAGVVTGYAVGILAGVCVVFGFIWGLIWLRLKITGDVPPIERSESRREGAQTRMARRSSRHSADYFGPVRPGHTRSVSGVTAVDDLEMGGVHEPQSPRRGEVVEVDPVTSEFMRETALGRPKK